MFGWIRAAKNCGSQRPTLSKINIQSPPLPLHSTLTPRHRYQEAKKNSHFHHLFNHRPNSHHLITYPNHSISTITNGSRKNVPWRHRQTRCKKTTAFVKRAPSFTRQIPTYYDIHRRSSVTLNWHGEPSHICPPLWHRPSLASQEDMPPIPSGSIVTGKTDATKTKSPATPSLRCQHVQTFVKILFAFLPLFLFPNTVIFSFSSFECFISIFRILEIFFCSFTPFISSFAICLQFSFSFHLPLHQPIYFSWFPPLFVFFPSFYCLIPLIFRRNHIYWN